MEAQYNVFFSAFSVLISCKKEKVSAVDDICHTWEAKTFRSPESIAYPKDENKPILLTFKKDGTYSLKLDITSCGGTFKAGNSHYIEIGFPAFTAAGYNSRFSHKLAVALSKVNSFSIKDHTLQLNVPQWGFIEFELVE